MGTETQLAPFLSSFVPLAVALLLSLALGRVASRHGIPRVTVYLLVGFLLGPHLGMRIFDSDGPVFRFLLGADSQVPLRVLQELAIGFILFGIGASFRFPVFREVGPRVLGVSAAEIGVTSLLVGGTVYAATGDWRLGLIAPALAVSSAPSATLVTLREFEAEGPTSRCLILCVGHNNLVVLRIYFAISRTRSTRSMCSSSSPRGAIFTSKHSPRVVCCWCSSLQREWRARYSDRASVCE